jgi:hypothetical protein
MIVSNRNHFIFVHIFKTAGTSIRRALRRHAMPVWKEPANHVLKRIGISQFGPDPYPDHMTASELITQTSLESFNAKFSFAFVRNPWDWELSHYKYILKKPRHQFHAEVKCLGGFSEYVRWRCDGRFRLQSSFLIHEGQRVVDFVGRFENLDADFEKVAQRLSISSKLKRLNQTRRTIYQQHYDTKTTELVAAAYQADIVEFGYEFQPHRESAA